jgi:hypothetical protein
MNPIKIVICDDTNAPFAGVAEEIDALKPKDSPPVQLISGAEISAVARGLEERRRSAVHPAGNATPWGNHEFDTVDLLIIDYNFIDLEEVSGLTGQRLAYLARCYSACKYIVVLNQFGTNRFDLTLQDHPVTHADLHLGSDQITSPGLWKESDWPEFRPWSWPVLPRAVESFEMRLADLSGSMDRTVLEWLGLENQAAALPRSVKQFLKEESVTFRSFAESSGAGLEQSDRPFHESTLLRIAASRIAKWLEYMVFAAQDLLIDFPRLVLRFPSLLGEKGSDVLENIALCPDVVSGFNLTSVEKHRYPMPHWISKPAWLRMGLMDDDSLRENVEDLPPQSRLRFAEDASRFLPEDATRGFVADLASPYIQRFVRRTAFDGVEYQPSIRFSL